MRRMLAFALILMWSLPCLAQEDKELVAQQSVVIRANVEAVWELVKDFDALPTWHPAFKDAVIKSGEANTKGTVRTLTLQSDESFDEELLGFDEQNKTYRYRIVGDSPFPIIDYVSNMFVTKGRKGTTKVVWQGKFKNKPGSGKTDKEVVEIIEGAYREGLNNLKMLAERG